MITVLVKALETKATKEIEELREENAILKVLFKQGIKNNIEYRELLEESLGLLDKYQEEVSNLKIRANLWADEVVRLYKQYGDLNKALQLKGREIMLYELNKNNGVEEE
ncbi:hypothetical protein FDE98_16630 [Clostridium sporogenes]|uniref:Uncharacterized protein n=1 Tax=Clostridium sporogenes TaxID=1509 RepID=A0A7X5PD50_CLOSG|nr:hypothetical protein [Clostridium sporogenes]AJD32680.1 hypothetical protein T258_1862 [Clostridium botulinum Prevot_594]MBY7016313.1 hypothetical protein [Clostridium sporogenes]NFQ18459.1 hypothetical protein [Clostridium sporogenes]NFQ21988.1 hypothetical protein [Clostridium sporogenes]NFQ28673.1 hypothetical protein [Clostridium sporogenes]